MNGVTVYWLPILFLPIVFVVALVVRRRYSVAFKKYIPYNSFVLAALFLYLGTNRPNPFVIGIAVFMLVLGVKELLKQHADRDDERHVTRE